MGFFDDRIFELTFEFGDQKLVIDGGIDFKASGMKYANALQNDCQLQISNLKRETREQLLTQTTPYNWDQKRKSFSISAGRESTGLFLLYKGDIIDCIASQPPDITLHIRSMAMAWYKLNYLAQAYNVTTPLSNVINGIGTSLGLKVNDKSTPKNVTNYSYSGSATGQIAKLNDCGVDAYEDNGTLVVKDRGTYLKSTHILSADSGMIGNPVFTEYGFRAKMLLEPNLVLGGKMILDSDINPILNGESQIYKLGFDIASRSTAFYSIIESSKFPILQSIANLPT